MSDWKLKYIIAGTGRCGTGYTSRLVTELGSDCGHEDIFGPYGVWHERLSKFDGDCSWMSIPYLNQFDGKIVHLVRDPLKVMRSKIATRWPLLDYLDNGHSRAYSRFALSVVPYEDDDIWSYNLRFYVKWNRLIEKFSGFRVRVERLRYIYGASDLATFLGFPRLSSTVLAEACKRASRSGENKHVTSGPNLSWEDFPDSKERDEAMSMAYSYGYPV